MMWKIFIVMALVMMFTGAIMYENDVTPEQIENVSEKIHYDNLNFTFQEKGNNQNNTFITRAIYKYGDFIGFVGVEGSRTAFKYGYKNPQYNFEFAYKLFFALIILTLIKPILYLLTFLGFCIYYIVQWFKTHLLRKNKTKNK